MRGTKHYEKLARLQDGTYVNAHGTVTASIRCFVFSVTDRDEFLAFVGATTRSAYKEVIFLTPVTVVDAPETSHECDVCGHVAMPRVHHCTCSLHTCAWCLSRSTTLV